MPRFRQDKRRKEQEEHGLHCEGDGGGQPDSRVRGDDEADRGDCAGISQHKPGGDGGAGAAADGGRDDGRDDER